MLKEGVYQPESRTEYFYHDDDNLDKIVYHRKKANGQPYISMVSKFHNQDGKVSSVINSYSSIILPGIINNVFDTVCVGLAKQYFSSKAVFSISA